MTRGFFSREDNVCSLSISDARFVTPDTCLEPIGISHIIYITEESICIGISIRPSNCAMTIGLFFPVLMISKIISNIITKVIRVGGLQKQQEKRIKDDGEP